MNKIISANIRTIREMKNFTRDFVAGEMDMSTSGYGKMERGEIDLTISKLSKLSTIFGISLSDLLFFDVSFFFYKDSERKSYNEKVNTNSEIRLVHVATNKYIKNSDDVGEKRKINNF